MSTSVASVTNHFPSAENGFTTTTSGSVSSGATTVGLNSVAGYSNGEVAVFVIDPSNASKQTFTGTIDTSGVQVTGVKWTAGTNTTHAAGATVVDYATATHISMMTKGILVEHDQDGTHSDITATSITATTGTFTNLTISGAATEEGWAALGDVPDTVTNNGNRSYDLVFNTNDLTDTVSPGMRLKMTRTVTAPTQCSDLETGSSQYFNKTSPAGTTFTDDFVCGAWVKLESYPAAGEHIAIGRTDATPANGWFFGIDGSGRVIMRGYNAGNSNWSQVLSYQSIPLNKWVHIAAQLDMSAFTATTTTSYVMIDGVDVPAAVSRSGSNPTALVQSGNLAVGSYGTFVTYTFDGKLAQVFYSSAKITQANVKTLMSQGLTASLISTHSIVSAYSLSNAITDLNTTTANNLTAQGSAVATATDSPFAGGNVTEFTDGTTEFGIVTKTAFSTNSTITVQVPEGYAIPTSGGVSAVSYSTHKIPYGFPATKSKWRINNLRKIGTSVTSNATYGAFDSNSWALNVPVGSWDVGWQTGAIFVTGSTSVYFNISATALTGLTNATGSDASPFAVRINNSAAVTMVGYAGVVQPQNVTTQSTYIMYTLGATTSAGINGNESLTEIFAEFSYL